MTDTTGGLKLIRDRYDVIPTPSGRAFQITLDGKALKRLYDSAYAAEATVERLVWQRWKKQQGLAAPKDRKRQHSYKAEWAARSASGRQAVPMACETAEENAAFFALTAAKRAGVKVLPKMKVFCQNGRGVTTGSANRHTQTMWLYGSGITCAHTVLHEYAHLIDASKTEPGHGPTWAALFVHLCETTPLTAEFGRALRASMETVHGPLAKPKIP